MATILDQILEASIKKEHLLTVLIDPEKFDLTGVLSFLEKVHNSKVTHIFVGGSTSTFFQTDLLVKALKKHTFLPIILFPGHYSQITPDADALLFLSLLSGNNPEYLIGQQLRSVKKLQEIAIEIIPTGYILIDGGVETTVQRVSKTKPLSIEKSSDIVDVATVAVYLGKKMIYLEAGSGALKSVPASIVKEVASAIDIPIIVGGGLRKVSDIEKLYEAGATMIVVGTAIEDNQEFLRELN